MIKANGRWALYLFAGSPIAQEVFVSECQWARFTILLLTASSVLDLSALLCMMLVSFALHGRR